MCKQAEKTQHSQRMSEEYEPGLVSVIIPTYNRADLVCEAIQSVLDQTYQNFEIIVVDDGSTDDTKQVLTLYKDKIIYIYQQNQGGSAARNTGLKHSKGEYISFVDSDDLWFLEKYGKDIPKKSPLRSRFTLRIGKILCRQGKMEEGRRYLWEAITSCPFNLRNWVNFLMSIAPFRMYKYLDFIKSSIMGCIIRFYRTKETGISKKAR